MFRNVLSNTPLTNDMADASFPHITGEAYQGDLSFVATLRALIAPRMSEGDTINVRYRTVTFDGDGSSARTIVQNAVGDVSAANTITVYNVRGAADGVKVIMDAVEELLPDVYSGFEFVEGPAKFFKASFRTLCAINTEIRSTLFFVDTMDLRKLHLLQMATLPALPWYFKKEDGVKEIEMNLMNSMNQKTPDAYLAVLREVASQYDFRTPRIRSLLAGFETKYERFEKENLSRAIRDIDGRLDDYNNRIRDELIKRRDLCVKLLGIECKLEQSNGESEIMDYFLCNKNLHLMNVTDDYMEFIATGYLDVFDPDMAERYISNGSSYFYKGNNEQNKNMKKLMTAIFIDETIKVRFMAGYRLYLSGTVEGFQIREMPGDIDGYMPNPHIQRHGCLGNNSSRINTLLREGNYIGAIEQAISSCHNLNLGDSTVMNGWMSDYFYRTHDMGRGIELPDGRVVTPADAITWINEQEAANGSKGKKKKEGAKDE